MKADTSKVLVTGGSGFVGGALLSRLHELNWPVLGISRAISTNDNIQSGPSLSMESDWRPWLNGRNIVIHTAARVHIMHDSNTDPLAAFRKANVDGTLALAQQAAETGVRRFVFISSIKVNGEATMPGLPFTEEDVPNPVGPYAVSKAEAEAALLHLAEESGMEVVIIRPPLVYGPGVKANFFSMMRWIQRGIPLPLGAVCHNRRTLVGLDNLTDLVITAMQHPAAVNQVFLAGDREDISTKELLQRLATAMDGSARLIPIPIWFLKFGATLLNKRKMIDRLCGNLQVDVSKARGLLGWTPRVSMDEGLKRTAAWYLEQVNG